MKFALCISGFMRLFRQQIRHLRAGFLDALDCDIYISTWDVVGHNKYKYSTGKQDERLTPDMLRAVYGNKLKNFTVKPFDPEAVTPQWIKDIPRLDWLNRRIASMYFHIWEANRLKRESGNRYDVTIRCRADLFFGGRITELLMNSPHAENRVFCPEIESYNMINDQFMFGSTAAMDRVACLYADIGVPQPWWCVEPAEKTLADYLALNGIEAVRVPVNYVRGS